MERSDLARKNLDRRLTGLRPAVFLARPPRGWLRAIREALGMTTGQMAKRLGVSQPRVIALEKDEQRGAVTLETLRRAAEALDCTLVYALAPTSPSKTWCENAPINLRLIALPESVTLCVWKTRAWCRKTSTPSLTEW